MPSHLADAQPHLDFTDFPATQFTEEEAGALGATAPSLQVLLDSLAGESRRRLQEVLDEDDFDFFDEDFEEPAASPRDTPPPTQQLESSTKVVTLDVKTKHKVTVQGSPPSSPSTITSTAEVNVTLTSKSKNKRRKKKSKSKTIPPDELQDSVDNIKVSTAQEVDQRKQSKRKTKSKSPNLLSSKPTSEQIKHQTFSGELQKNVVSVSKNKTTVCAKDSATLIKKNVVKSVEIDENGVAYIKKAGQISPGDNMDPTSSSVNETALGAIKRDVVSQTNYSEEIQYKYNKQSFVSNSTQYHSPPEDMLGDENIDKYLKSIEREKEQIGAYLQSKTKPKPPQIDLPQYIDKLLTMTRDSVEQLSVSDVTESSSDQVLGRRKKKKKSKSKSSPSTSTEMAGSRSTEDSHLTLSEPSPGIPNVPMTDSASASTVQLSSSSSLDSKLKFSDSSSNKDYDSKLAKSTLDQNKSGARLSPIELDSTAYLTLHDLSSKVPGKANLDPPKTSTVDIFVDLTKLPPLSPSHSADYTDVIIRLVLQLSMVTVCVKRFELKFSNRSGLFKINVQYFLFAFHVLKCTRFYKPKKCTCYFAI